MLTTDDSEFGGFNRIDKSIVYFSTSEGQLTTLKKNYLSLYLPARTGMVIKRMPVKSVYEKKV
jgi:1,4-alpha-glucan branching enzyme